MLIGGIQMKKVKLTITALLFFTLILQLMFTPVFAAQFNDIRGHWAEAQINNWVSKGLVKGYSNGTFKPNSEIKRAEFMALVNRAFGFTKTADIEFSDVSTDDWYSQDISKAQAQGYISGYGDNTARPEEPITRQEVAVILGRILKLQELASSAYKYSDNIKMADWGIGYIGAISSLGYIKGYSDNTFKPDNNATRAEVIAILYKAAGTLFNEAGSYGPSSGFTNIAGNVTVNRPDINLKRLTISGNLYLTEGIGTGSVSLENVTVYGTTTISGGGLNSVKLLSSSLGKVVINSPDSIEVRVSAEGSTSISTVYAQTPARLEENNLIGQGFTDVKINSPTWNIVELSGDFNSVDLDCLQAQANIITGTITQLNVTKNARGAYINQYSNSIIKTANFNEAASVYGIGKIVLANINTDGTTIAKKPDTVKYAAGVTATIAGTSDTRTVYFHSIDDQTCTVGSSVDITVISYPDSASKNATSNNTSIATTSFSGNVLTVKAGRFVGTATITVKGTYSNYTSSSQAFKITVTDATGVTASAAQTTAGQAGTLQVNKITVPNNARLGSYEVKKISVGSGASLGSNEINKMVLTGRSVTTTGNITVKVDYGSVSQSKSVAVSTTDTISNVVDNICSSINSDAAISSDYISSNENGTTVVLASKTNVPDRNLALQIINDGNTGIGTQIGNIISHGRSPGTGNINFTLTDMTTAPAVSVTLAVTAGESSSIIANNLINAIKANTNFISYYNSYTLSSESGNTLVLTSNTKQADRSIRMNITDTDNTGVGNTTGTSNILGAAPGTGNITFQVSDGTINQTVAVAVTDGDSAASVAQKILSALNSNSTITGAYNLAIESGNILVLSCKNSQTARVVTLVLNDLGNTGVGSVTTNTPNSAGIASVHEVNTLTITHEATKTGVLKCTFSDGNISVTEYVNVFHDNSIYTVAYAIYYAFYGNISGYTVSMPSAGAVTFTNNTGEADRNVVITVKDK